MKRGLFSLLSKVERVKLATYPFYALSAYFRNAGRRESKPGADAM